METPGSDDAVLLRERNGVLFIELNRPAARNAVNVQMAEALRSATEYLDGSESLIVGVLFGAGGTFCAGMDLKAFAQGELPVLERGGFAGITAAPPRKPLIAAVEGWALAGGLEIALACDLIVASSEAQFGLPEVSRGLIAAAGGLVELPRRIPRSLAMQMALTGQPISAAVAHQNGLVSEVVEPGATLAAATRLAESIATNSPHAVQLSKQIIQDSVSWPAFGWESTQAETVGDLYASADALEGARAFAERRPPRWR